MRRAYEENVNIYRPNTARMYRATTFLNSRSEILRLGSQLPNPKVLDFEFLKTLLLRIRVFRDVKLCRLMSVP